MKVLIIGVDGSTHPVAWKLARSPAVSELFTAPGNFGTNMVGANVALQPTEVEELCAWAKATAIDLAIVASPHAATYGIVDTFREAELRIVGASRAVMGLENSRIGLAAFLERHGIAQDRTRLLRDVQEARTYFREVSHIDWPLLVTPITADGAEGLPAVCGDTAEAQDMATAAFARRGAVGRCALVAEPYIRGQAFSLVAVTDGATTRPVSTVRGVRAAFDGDRGPLTPGMGAWSPATGAGQDVVEAVLERMVTPLLAGLRADGHRYAGPLCVEVVLGGGDINIRRVEFGFGALESLVLLPRWEDDLYIVLDAVLDTALGDLRPFKLLETITCSVVVAAEGYPDQFETGYGILGLGDVPGATQVFHLNTRTPQRKGADLVMPKFDKNARNLGRGFSTWIMPSRGRARKVDADAARAGGDPYSQIITAGGLVVASIGKGRTLEEARGLALRGAEAIAFTGRWWRTDIGVGQPV